MYGVSLKDKCKNSDVRERCGVREDVGTRVERGTLLWFGHLERVYAVRGLGLKGDLMIYMRDINSDVVGFEPSARVTLLSYTAPPPTM
ncbi:hypothetical protein EVAR_60383_1 [Eumeta japonica]|uniref:Uncharacterized protein n=1 Tax=Eumeta variegata TaxID=151549 RepID=A0A4C1ZQ49_EUMVA|nr:hypothetical protein EVAR_60383_1 [Eumeta japonica]